MPIRLNWCLICGAEKITVWSDSPCWGTSIGSERR
jgi:hypothetical protein